MTPTVPRVVVVGSCNVDLTFRCERLPQPGETLAGRSLQVGSGGKGANQAVMAARLGVDVAMVGRVGDDAFADGVRTGLAAESIDITHLQKTPHTATGSAAILVDDAGRNCIVAVPGANAALSRDDVSAAAEMIRSAAVLLCQLEVPTDTTHLALLAGRTAGVRTILNPAPATDLSDELLACADLIVPNEPELARLTGLPVDDLAQIEIAARALLGRSRAAVIVTLGARGALLVHGPETTRFPAEPVSAADTSGAGDAFIGALGALLSASVPLHDAIRKANALAALTVTRPGTQASFPSRDEAREVVISER
jgi:ribokinase